MAELKGLLFDVDGTLVDNLAYHFAAFDEYAKREGFTLLEPMSLKMNGMHSNQIFPMMRDVGITNTNRTILFVVYAIITHSCHNICSF